MTTALEKRVEALERGLRLSGLMVCGVCGEWHAQHGVLVPGDKPRSVESIHRPCLLEWLAAASPALLKRARPFLARALLGVRVAWAQSPEVARIELIFPGITGDTKTLMRKSQGHAAGG